VKIKSSLPVSIKTFISFAALLAMLFSLPGGASASQLVLNGNFNGNLDNWVAEEITKGAKMSWDTAGFEDDGSILFKISGRRTRGETRAAQKIVTRIQAGSSGKLEFAWKKNWSAILPIEQRIYAQLIKPDKTTVTLWVDKTLLNDNVWTAQSIDISGFLDQDGQYSVRFGAAFENGNSSAATTYAWFDNVRLTTSTGTTNKPKTSLISPTGFHKLAGKSYPVNGIAISDVGVAKVEIAIVRLYDNSYWNGNSWVKDIFWNQAEITSDKGKRLAAWAYVWPLPTSDGAHFKILARSTDITENVEVPPIENNVQVDNVGPTGNIYIEDAATYTNNRQVRVDIDVKGATKMRFSVNNGASWTSWESFAVGKTLTLPKGDGTKVVSAQFKDDSNNIYRISDSIMLDTTPPVTRHTFPTDKAKDITPNSSIGVVFYENMDPLSFKNDGTEQGSTIYIKQGSRWIAAETSYDDKTKTAKLVPKNPLDPGTIYTVYLDSGIKDAAGNALAANFSWNFTTAGSYRFSFKETIGAAGGKLEDGNQIISLEIPQGALAADTVVAIEELRDNKVPKMDGFTRYSPVYQMTPAQLPFIVPATLKIQYKLDEIPNPTDLRLVMYDDQQKKWLSAPDARIDLVNNQIIAPLPHLTIVAVTAQKDTSAPTTTIMAPTGAAELAGRLYNAYGLSTDNSGIAKVELAINRQSDNAYWNGADWQASEVWVEAKIVDKTERTRVTWFYRWVLPADKYTAYQIRARATDNDGNVESNPNAIQVKLKGN